MIFKTRTAYQIILEIGIFIAFPYLPPGLVRTGSELRPACS